MKKIVTTSFLATVIVGMTTLSSCGNNKVSTPTTATNGSAQESTPASDGNIIKVRDFDEIEVSCAAEVVYVAGGGNPVVIVTTDNETRKNVVVEVHERQLHLGVKGNNNYDQLKFEVHGTSKLDDIEIMGACSFSNKGQLNPRDLDIDCSGASSVTINNISCTELNVDCSGASKADITDISCDELDLTSTGASTITISGRCLNAEYEANGASTIDATNMRSTKIRKMQSAGASTIKVQ